MSAQYKTIEDLKKAARDKFSDEEIEKFMDMGRRLACYPVLSELINTVEARPNFDVSGKKLCDTIIDTFEYKSCGHVSIPMRVNDKPIISDDDGEIVIGMSLSITKKDDKPEFHAPAEFANEIVEQMHHMVGTAKAYWGSYSQKHKKLLKKVANYRPNVDFSELKCDPENPIMLYFDKNSPTRVCVFTYYYNIKTNKIMIGKPSTVNTMPHIPGSGNVDATSGSEGSDTTSDAVSDATSDTTSVVSDNTDTVSVVNDTIDAVNDTTSENAVDTDN